MYKLIAPSLFILLACNTPKSTTMSSANNGGSWISLFDGSTTTGWHTYGKNTIGKAWKAENGVLHLDASSKKDWQTEEGGDIVTNESFENFHFSVEWKNVAPETTGGRNKRCGRPRNKTHFPNTRSGSWLRHKV